MGILLVGPDNSKLFSKRTTWDFEEALNAVNDGDTIEFMKNFSPYFEGYSDKIIIDKNITFLGHLDESNGQKMLTTTLSNMLIKNGATVTIKNIHIKADKEKSNGLSVKEGANVLVDNVLIENSASAGDIYPVVILMGNSSVELNQVTVQSATDSCRNARVHVSDSTLVALNTVINVGITGNNANFNLSNTLLQNEHAHALLVNNHSRVQLTGVQLIGGNIEQDIYWPCMKFDQSEGVFDDVLIEKHEADGEVIDLTNYNIIMLNDSTVQFNQLQVQPSIHPTLNTQLFVKDSTFSGSNGQFNVKVMGNHAQLTFSDTLIQNTNSHALSAIQQSSVQLNTVQISGGKIGQDAYSSCLRLHQSTGVFENILVEQPNFYAAMDLIHSTTTVIQSRIDSLQLRRSTVRIERTPIVESFFVKDHSIVEATVIDILGKWNKKIPLYANANSSIHANRLNLGDVGFPNIKMEYNVHFNVEKINLFVYDEQNEDAQRDENGDLIILNKETTIEYFGEKRPSQRLSELIGMDQLKQDIDEFIKFTQMKQLRAEQGLENSGLSLHSLFLGSPGTGKTTVARIIGALLYEKNIIAKDVFVEVSRTDLVADYVGQTAPKTRAVLESALGGVLFIDEAYALSRGGANDFGFEALTEILSFMENYRTDIVIIFAGYPEEMNTFLKINPGLESRIPNIFKFPEYTTHELTQIGLFDLADQKYQVNEESYRELVFNNYKHSYDYSNGRWIRNLNERIVRKLASRVIETDSSNLTEILDEDLHTLMLYPKN